MEGERSYSYEDALVLIGYGRFHWALLAVTGWALMTDSIEILSIAFLLPSAGCDLRMSTVDKGWLNAISFLGMMSGSYGWGTLADIHGRRRMFLLSLTLNGMAAMVSSLMQTYWAFLLCRFISGVGVGGNIPVIFSYFSEFLPRHRRGTVLAAMSSLWIFGNIIAAGMAWAVIPHKDLGYFSPYFTFNSWRIYILLTGVPCLSAALIFLFMPESPKYLLKNGQEEEALKILSAIYRSNHGTEEGFDVKSIYLNSDMGEESEGLILLQKNGYMKRYCAEMNSSFKQFMAQTKKLFTRPFLKNNLILIFVEGTVSFGYYGLLMWFPELFKRMEEHGGSACEAAQYSYTNASLPLSTNQTCGDPPDASIFIETFITVVCAIPGAVVGVVLIDKVGGIYLGVASMILTGISVFFIWLVKTRAEAIAMSSVFSCFSIVIWNSILVVSAEAFPTEVRSTSFGLNLMAARLGAILGNLAFGALVDTQCAIPMLLVAGLLTAAGVTTLLLPNKKQQDID